MSFFKQISNDNDSLTKARAGIINTGHGDILTPVFMPVGTQATVKAVSHESLEQNINSSIILNNTYHLYLRPGLDILKKLGGLHRFTTWNRSILTDSGGFQVYSLGNSCKVTDKGVYFQSHLDGKKHLFTPESVINAQRVMGADIIMAFDDCPPYPSSHNTVETSVHRSINWLSRCIETFLQSRSLYGHKQTLFPIIQGGVYKELRKYMIDKLLENKYHFDGFGIGGLSVGEPKKDLIEVTKYICDLLPPDKPRYLMGVGTPEDLILCIDLGIDMFDCVMPTRNARNGMLFTTKGIINIRNKKWENNDEPIEFNLKKSPAFRYSKAYLRHLFYAKEIFAAEIASTHNLCFYIWLMKEARKYIIKQKFSSWKKNILPIITTRL